MAVRVRVRIKFEGRAVDVVALANSGFESRAAETVVPRSIAEKLRKPKRLPRRAVSYTAAGGTALSLVPLGQGTLQVLVPDRSGNAVSARLLVSSDETEVVKNDVLVEALGLGLLKPAHGIWRFCDDANDRERPSEPRTTY